jgi:hypothetical protein
VRASGIHIGNAGWRSHDPFGTGHFDRDRRVYLATNAGRGNLTARLEALIDVALRIGERLHLARATAFMQITGGRTELNGAIRAADFGVNKQAGTAPNN